MNGSLRATPGPSSLTRYRHSGVGCQLLGRYGTEVNITWPDTQLERQFKITDNGHGMTRDEFQYIWRTIAYNRLSSGGATTVPPDDVQGIPALCSERTARAALPASALPLNT